MQWLQPPEHLSLTAEEVHVWLVNLDAAAEGIRLSELQTMLAEDEIARAQRFHFSQHRHRFICGRGMLRVILARYLNLEPQAIAFDYGSHGKPFLQKPSRNLTSDLASNLSFNLSHAEGLALYIVALGRDVGIDVECIDRDRAIDEIITRFFTRLEQAYLLDLHLTARQTAFFQCWTCKEAQAKATGEGLFQGLDQLDLSTMLAKSHRSMYFNPWKIVLLDLVNGWRDHYTAAIAVAGQDWQLKCWEYPMG